MNLSKARDFFSDYYEGSLDAGLKQSFEQAMASNAQVREEYEDFKRMMDGLSSLAEEEIEVPIFLSDRIATRLEEAQEKKLSAVPAWMGWFRNLAFASLGAAVIFGAAYGLMSGGGNVATGSFFNSGQPSVTPKNELVYDFKNGDVVVTFTTSSDRGLLVNATRYTTQNGTRIQPLTNTNAYAAAFTVQAEGSEVVDTIIVPGTTRREPGDGTGTLEEFGKALADRYGVPVRLTAALETPVKWTLSEADAYACAKAAVDGQALTVDQRPGGFIVISGRK